MKTVDEKLGLTSGNYTIGTAFEEICAIAPEKTGLIFDDETLTFQELNNYISNLTHNLKRLGIKKGSRVAIMLENCKEYIFVYFALFTCGAWAIPLNTRWEKPEIGNVLGDGSIDTIIFSKQIGIFDMSEILVDLKPNYPFLERMIVLDIEQIEKNYKKDMIDFQTLLEKPAGPAPKSETVLPEDIALLSYTSGSTGSPKGVLLSHDHIVKTASNIATIWFNPGQVTLYIAPFYAAQGFSSILINFMSGETGHFISTFTPNKILEYISLGKCNFIATQPTMWSLLISSQAIKFSNFSSLEKVGTSGSVCSHTLAKRIEETFGCVMLNTYGCVETTGGVTASRVGDDETIRLNTVGRVFPGFEIKIVDQNRKEVPRGEIGELAVKGNLMVGYLNNEEKTKRVVDGEGWLYTGDLAKYYDEENITIVGRNKDMVIRGGFNIYPLDIEDVILDHPKVQQVAVVGKDHPVIGEQTVAFVVPRAGESITKNDIISICKGRIANYKLPDHVHFIAQMPIILAGKVDKKQLKRWVEEGIPEEIIMTNQP